MKSSSRRWSRPARVLVVALAAAAPALAPARAAAEPPGSGSDPRSDGSAGTTPAPDPGTGVVLRAWRDRLTGSLDSIDAEVQAQVGALAKARSAQASAKAEVARADAAVAGTRKRIAVLADQSDQVVIDAFVDPPTASALDVLASASTADATVKQAILDGQSDADAQALGRLEAAKARLERQRRDRSRAATTARRRADDSAAALADLVEAQSQESLFVSAVQERLADNLSEAEALARLDPAAAAALRARARELGGKIDKLIAARKRREAQAALAAAMRQAAARAAADAAAQAQAQARASASAASAAGSGQVGLATVACPSGGSITVAASIAGGLRSMLAAAAGAGLPLCGSGYRDPAEQVALRRAHCGTSTYAIYEAPASACSPPTAKPGSSKHEQGLAIDFTCGSGTISRGSPCFDWLAAHAAGYGFANLPTEPWHWSVDGT